MENKSHAMAAGLFVALLTVLVLGLAAWLTRDTGIRDTYEISTRDTVSGLQEQAPVRFRGIDVGKVSSIGFDPRTPGNALIRIEVDRNAPLTRGTFATLSYQGVTGLAFVQLSDDGKVSERLQPDDALPPRIPLRPGLLAKLEAQGEVLLERVGEATARLNKLLNDENQRKFTTAIDNLGQAADSAGALAKRLDQTAAKRLDPALDEAVTTLRSVRKNVDEVGRTAADFGATARRINEKGGPLDRLGEGTDALSHAAEGFSNTTLPRINRTTDEAARAVRALGRAVDELTENPQALIYGTGTPRPGPGEPGFQAPGAR